MMVLAIVSAAPTDVLQELQKTNPSRTGVGYVVGAVCLVVLIVVGWAAFIRKPKDERARRYSYANDSEAPGAGGNNRDDSTGKRRRRRRRQRRNPTLAETGG